MCGAQPVDVNKLVKGRPLDNMEFMQWFKAYWDSCLGSQHLNYDPAGRRALAKSGDMKGAAARPAGACAVATAASTGRRMPSELVRQHLHVQFWHTEGECMSECCY